MMSRGKKKAVSPVLISADRRGLASWSHHTDVMVQFQSYGNKKVEFQSDSRESFKARWSTAPPSWVTDDSLGASSAGACDHMTNGRFDSWPCFGVTIINS